MHGQGVLTWIWLDGMRFEGEFRDDQALVKAVYDARGYADAGALPDGVYDVQVVLESLKHQSAFSGKGTVRHDIDEMMEPPDVDTLGDEQE